MLALLESTAICTSTATIVEPQDFCIESSKNLKLSGGHSYIYSGQMPEQNV